MAAELVPVDEVFPVSIIAPAADLAGRIAKTEFVPGALRNRPEAVLACMLAGHEIGIGPMQALSKIHIIDGRPAIAAELMRALVQREGHEVWFDDMSNSRVTVCGRRKESEHVTRVTWTMDDAKQADLANKKNWRQYPRAMLAARATGELCRMVFADVLGGISYTPEELDDGILEVEGEEVPPADKPKGITRKASPARKSTAKKAPAAPTAQSSEPPLPPLPGEDEPSAEASGGQDPERGSLTDDPNVMERSKSIANACQRAGLDDDGRHRLIGFATSGRVTSSKEVTAGEGGDVLQAAHAIAVGRASLIEGDDGWELVYDPNPPAEEDATGEGELVGDEDQADGVVSWSAEEWRALLKDKGVKVTATVQAAQGFARELEIKPLPTSLDHLAGHGELCVRLFRWVEEQSGG